MPIGLERRQQTGQLHFITFSCYRRLPLLEDPDSMNTVEQVIEKARQSHVDGWPMHPTQPMHPAGFILELGQSRYRFSIGERSQTIEGNQAMSVANDVRSEIKAAKNLRLPWWGVLCGIIGSFLCAWLFDNFGKLELVLPMLNSIAVLGFMLVLKRKLWPHAWFWITMAVIATFHVLLVLSVPWTTRWVPALAIAVIDSADFCLLLWIVAVIGKLIGQPRADEI